MEMTGGRGADLVVEASGAAPGIALAFKLVRKLGRIAAIGLTGKEKIEFPYDAGMTKSIDFVFNMSTSYTSWDKAIRLIDSRRVDVAPLITHRADSKSGRNFSPRWKTRRESRAVLIP